VSNGLPNLQKTPHVHYRSLQIIELTCWRRLASIDSQTLHTLQNWFGDQMLLDLHELAGGLLSLPYATSPPALKLSATVI